MQGRGIFGGSGLGALTTGIFAGPTALGTSLSGGDLGYVPPSGCYKNQTFVQKDQECAQKATAECDDIDCMTSKYAACAQAAVATTGCGGGSTGISPSATGPCGSAQVVAYVQTLVKPANAPAGWIDGKWGPNTAAAVKSSGNTFVQLAPMCTGQAPDGSNATGPAGGGGVAPTGGGGGATVVSPGGGGTTTPVKPGPAPFVGGGGGGGGGGAQPGVMGMLTGETIIKGIPNWAVVAGGLVLGYAAYSIYQQKQADAGYAGDDMGYDF